MSLSKEALEAIDLAGRWQRSCRMGGKGTEAMSITFTQFRRPHGIPERVTIDRPDAITAKAYALTVCGARFEAELLMTGHASFECVIDDDEGEPVTLASELVPNGPGVPEAVDRLVERASQALAERFGTAVDARSVTYLRSG